MSKITKKPDADLSIVDIIDYKSKSQGMDVVPDLPLDLAFLDIESLLPKLGQLPFGGLEWVTAQSRCVSLN